MAILKKLGMQKKIKRGLLCGFFIAFPCVSHAKSPSYLSHYQPVAPLSGNISTVGSDTLANLMSEWAMLFKSFYPDVNVQIQTSGSASAMTALLEATAQIGSMSRVVSEREKAQFAKRYGYEPQAIKIGMDVLAIFVNQDNPISSITPEQVDAIYSQSPSCGRGTKIQTWGELGLTGGLAKKPIQLFGRNAISGTYVFFKHHFYLLY